MLVSTQHAGPFTLDRNTFRGCQAAQAASCRGAAGHALEPVQHGCSHEAWRARAPKLSCLGPCCG